MKRLVVLAVLVVGWGGAAQARPVLIAHPQNTVAVDRELARKMLLGEALFWPSGTPVEVFEVKADEPVVESGYLDVTRKTLTQVRAAWNRLVFAGKAEPPVRVGTSAEARAEVARRQWAVALVDESVVDKSVRVLLRLP